MAEGFQEEFFLDIDLKEEKMKKEKTYFGMTCPELEASQDAKTKRLIIRINDSQMSIQANRLLSDKEMKRIVEDVCSIYDILNKKEKDFVDCDGRECDPNEIVYPGEAYLGDDKEGKMIGYIKDFFISLVILGIPVLLFFNLIQIFYGNN